MSLDTTLAAIDTVLSSCTQCGKPLGCSPSDDFCSEPCQRRWMRASAHGADEIDELLAALERALHAVDLV